nr:MAG TPA: KilAC domain protein [Caudoviricetes sp.]
MANEITVININGIECYERDGTAYLKLETVARGLGFTQEKGGVEYVRWETVDRYLREIGFPSKLGKDFSPASFGRPDFIPENIFYRLAMKAKNEAAEAFQAKIADEVIPAIRKHGAYMTPEVIERTLTDPDYIIQLATTLKEERHKRKALEAQAEADKPKVLFADSVASSQTSILVGELAKLLRQNGVDIGGTRLFRWLRENGYLIRRSGSDYNMPTQRSMELGLFKIKETAITHADGTVTVSKTVKVTPKAQIYFVNKFLGEANVGRRI